MRPLVLQRDNTEARSAWCLRVPGILDQVSHGSNQLESIPFTDFYPFPTFFLYYLSLFHHLIENFVINSLPVPKPLPQVLFLGEFIKDSFIKLLSVVSNQKPN